MKNFDVYRNQFEKNYTKIVYDLLKEKLFVSFGLELTATKIKFMSNEDFPLVGKTFAFYNPLDDSISINIEDQFFMNGSDVDNIAKMIFIMFHEAYHKTLMHNERKGVKDHSLWNIASDYEVHNMLYLYCSVAEQNNSALKKYFEYINKMLANWNNKAYTPKNGEIKGLFSETVLDKVAEEIYAMILNSKKTSSKSSKVKISSNGMGGSGNGSDSNDANSDGDSSEVEVEVVEEEYTLPDGTTHKEVYVKWPKVKSTLSEEAQKDQQNSKELRKQLMESNVRAEAERYKGSMSGKCETFLKKLFKIKVDWEKILKASLQTILCKSDNFTWARPRTSMYAMDIYLPDIDSNNEAYGTLIVARDESGSMSDEEVAKCGAIIADAKEHYKKIIILKHDTEIQYKEEFEDLNDDVIKMLCTRATCGGTSHKEVFNYISDYYKRHRYEDDAISCVILMTDCCSDIQNTQTVIPSSIPMIYLVPESGMSYTKGINGKIIPIEL